jgi:YD repeat-containing protein
VTASSWTTDADGNRHERDYDGNGNVTSSSDDKTNRDGSKTHTETTRDSQGVAHSSETTTSADGKTTTTATKDRNDDGTYSSSTSTTTKNDDGSTTTETETDDGHGNKDSGFVIVSDNSSYPAPDDTGSASEYPQFEHAVFVGKSLGWQAPGSDPEDPEAVPEGVPLAQYVGDRLHDAIVAGISGTGNGWGDAAAEEPFLPPFEDLQAGSSSSGAGDDWGLLHPQALIDRAIAVATKSTGTRLARSRLEALNRALRSQT